MCYKDLVDGGLLNISLYTSEEVMRSQIIFALALFGVGSVTRVSAKSDVFGFPLCRRIFGSVEDTDRGLCRFIVLDRN